MNIQEPGKDLGDGHRVGDIVLCEGSAWLLLGKYQLPFGNFNACWLIPPGLDFPRKFEFEARYVTLLESDVITLKSCPENITIHEHYQWVIGCLDNLRTARRQFSLAEIIKS